MVNQFLKQYSYNTQIEVSLLDLQSLTQRHNESFADYITRFREKAACMRNRPDEIDQVRIAWENAQESIRQEIGVMSMRSFADLYYAGVQAERIARFRKPTQVQKKGTQSAYAPKVATSSSSVVAKTSKTVF